MNNEEKILAILEEHGKMFEKMQADISGLKAGQYAMQADISGLKAGQSAMQADISGLKAGQSAMQADISGLKAGQYAMQADISGLKAGQSAMQDDITGIKLRLELDVEKRFDAVNESIDAIEKRLGTLDEVKELAEETRDKVDAIHSAVVRHGQDIAELKKAQ